MSELTTRQTDEAFRPLRADTCQVTNPHRSAGQSAAPTRNFDGGDDQLVPRQGPPTRLMVVDDAPRVRAAIAQTVSGEADLTLVAECSNAQSAAALAVSSFATVALVDLLLPDQGIGLDLVRSISATSGCAVVAMSVRSGLRNDALAAGAVAFVEKGSDIGAVLDAVRAAKASQG